MIKYLCGIGLCALLAACGGGSGYSEPPVQPPVVEPPVSLDIGPQVDLQMAKADAVTEVAEPVAIDTVIVTTPEDSEPKAL